MADDRHLESLYLGAHPVIQPFFERLRLRTFFQEALGGPDGRLPVPHVDTALLLVRNFTLSRHPLYGVPDWVCRFDPAQLELEPRQLEFLNDDRLGRTLDKLFEVDLRTFMTRLVVHMVQEFNLDLQRMHNDSTSITFTGVYRPKRPRKDGRRHLKIVRGFKIMDHTQTRAWLQVELVSRDQHTYKQQNRGRPGQNTRYQRQTTTVYEPVVTLNTQAIQASAAADGIFPLITDMSADQISSVDLLKAYKYQPQIEKRHEQLKTVTEVAPVNFKSVERIEVFLFLYFVAVLVHALIEREVRHAMKRRKIKSIPLYPEERACRAPTADKNLELFEPLRRHRLFERDTLVQTFGDELSDVRRTVLELIQVPTSAYGC